MSVQFESRQTTEVPPPLDDAALRLRLHTAERIAVACAGLDLFGRLCAVRQALTGRLVLITSFGIEDQALTHAVFEDDLDIEVITLDTGRLFPETYDVWAQTERRYRRRIHCLYPRHDAVETLVAQQGIDGFRDSVEARHRCCHVRKVEPLGRALAGASGWITGLRAEQSADRVATPCAAVDDEHALIKVNPLFDWSRTRVVEFIAAHRIPYNPLHERGYPSIGCAPCTRAVKPGEPERSGRWWWEHEEKKECGLHLASRRNAASADSVE
jgi:phosphoadenosine phosphosulfate reductase